MIETSAILFLCAAFFMASFVDAIAGGGGLISLPAFILTGMPMHNVYGCNKFACCVGSALSSGRFIRSGIIDMKVAVPMGAVVFLSSIAASRLVLLMDGEILKIMILLSMPAVAVLIFCQRSYPEENRRHTLSRGQMIRRLIFCGVAMGLFDGMLGPGSGTLAIILCTKFMRMDLATASGNTKTMVFASTTAGTVSYVLAGTVLWEVAIPVTAVGLLGSYLGSGMAIKKGAGFIRPMMLLIAVLLMIKLAADVLGNYL